MPVSPQDFALYSRMTGTPVPMDPMTRMQMAPDVYKFTKDYAKKPNLLETTGNLVKTVGKIGLMGLGQGFKASQANEERAIELQNALLKSKITGDTEAPKTTAEKVKQVEIDSQTAEGQVEKKTEQGSKLADSNNIAEELSRSQAMGPAFDEMVGEAATGDRVDKFLDQFTHVDSMDKGKGPGLDRALMGLLDQNRGEEELVGEGIVGPSTSIPYNRFDHPDIKADGGEHDDNLVGASNFSPVVMETEPSPVPTPEIEQKPSVSEKVDDFKSKFVEGAYSVPIRGQFHGKSLGLTVIPATNGEAQRGFVVADKALDKSPTTATTYGFGVSPKSEDYLQDYPITEQNFDTMMQRGMTEAKQRGKRKAGEIFGYLSVPKRVVTGKAQLGGFGQIDPNFALPSMQN